MSVTCADVKVLAMTSFFLQNQGVSWPKLPVTEVPMSFLGAQDVTFTKFPI